MTLPETEAPQGDEEYLASCVSDTDQIDRRTPTRMDNPGAPRDCAHGAASAPRRHTPACFAALRRAIPAGSGWLSKPSKYLAVGGSGVVVNSGALAFFHQLLSMPLVPSSILAVELSIANNYIWNDRWTFGRRWPSWRRFFKFNLVSLGGLVITTGVLWVLVTGAHSPYLLANLLGILLATIWNFVINLFWTWGRT
jgi:putative flippase GtrA